MPEGWIRAVLKVVLDASAATAACKLVFLVAAFATAARKWSGVPVNLEICGRKRVFPLLADVRETPAANLVFLSRSFAHIGVAVRKPDNTCNSLLLCPRPIS